MRRSAQRRDPEGGTRAKRTAGGVRKTEAAAISMQLGRALAAWGEAQAVISKQLTASFRAWMAASNAAKPVAKPAPVKAPTPAPKGMEEALQALRAKAITFDAFERATKVDWDKLAALLFRRWPLPAGVEVSDVRQELLIAVVRKDKDGRTLIEKWDSSKSVTLARYVAWNAMVWAARWIHDQRGVFKTTANKGSRGRDQGNVPRVLSTFERADGSSAAPESVAPPEQGEARAFVETHAAIVAKLRSPRDRTVLAVYLDVGGSIAEAAEILARDARLGMTEKQGVIAVGETLERTRWAARRVMAMQQAEV